MAKLLLEHSKTQMPLRMKMQWLWWHGFISQSSSIAGIRPPLKLPMPNKHIFSSTNLWVWPGFRHFSIKGFDYCHLNLISLFLGLDSVPATMSLGCKPLTCQAQDSYPILLSEAGAVPLKPGVWGGGRSSFSGEIRKKESWKLSTQKQQISPQCHHSPYLWARKGKSRMFFSKTLEVKIKSTVET